MYTAIAPVWEPLVRTEHIVSVIRLGVDKWRVGKMWEKPGLPVQINAVTDMGIEMFEDLVVMLVGKWKVPVLRATTAFFAGS